MCVCIYRHTHAYTDTYIHRWWEGRGGERGRIGRNSRKKIEKERDEVRVRERVVGEIREREVGGRARGRGREKTKGKKEKVHTYH